MWLNARPSVALQCGWTQNKMLHSNVRQPMPKWYSLMWYTYSAHPCHSSLVLEMDGWKEQLPRSSRLCFIEVLFYIQPILSIFYFDFLANRKRSLGITRYDSETPKIDKKGWNENFSFYSIYEWLLAVFEIMVFAAYCISVQLSIFLRWKYQFYNLYQGTLGPTRSPTRSQNDSLFKQTDPEEVVTHRHIINLQRQSLWKV